MNKKLLLLTSLGLVGAALTGCNKDKKDEEKKNPEDVKFSTLVVREEEYYDGELESYDLYEYDENGKKTKDSVFVKKDGSETEFYNKYTHAYTYNDKGYLIKDDQKFYKENGDLNEDEHDVEEYLEYDSHGRYGKYVFTYLEDGAEIVYTKSYAYQYVDGTDKLSKVIMTTNDDYMERKTFTYDEKGRLTKEEYDTAHDSVGPFEPDSYIEYKYFGDTDLVAEWHEYKYKNGEFAEDFSSITIFDSQGRELVIEEWLYGELITSSVFEYTNRKTIEIETSYGSDSKPIRYDVSVDEYDLYGRLTSTTGYYNLENPNNIPATASVKTVFIYKNL